MILGIHGHPKESGTGFVLLEEALSSARDKGAETKLVRVADYPVAGCVACDACAAGTGCRIHDPMWDVYPLLARCEGLIVSTPVFFGGPPSELKAWIDRCNPFWKDRKTLPRNERPRRPGALIVTAGSSRVTTFLGVVESMRAFFCTLDVDFSAQLLVSGLDHKPGPHPTPEHREQARGLGSKVAELRNGAPFAAELSWWDHPADK